MAKIRYHYKDDAATARAGCRQGIWLAWCDTLWQIKQHNRAKSPAQTTCPKCKLLLKRAGLLQEPQE